jgi:molybdopterin-guanine dinucleotide biosynthesis protein A
MPSSAIVLCGGLSSRMGRAKALLPWRGVTMIEHVVGVLRETVDEVVVVSSDELELPTLPATVVRDREPKLGPLGGLREGLHAMRGDLAFATSTDAPFLTPAFVRRVLSFGGAAAPLVDGFVQPLAAAYPKSLAETADRLIGERRMRLLHLLETCGYRAIAPTELVDLAALRDLDTPADYLAALADDGQRGEVVIELFGMAQVRAGAAEIAVAAGTLSEVLAGIERAKPELRVRDDDHLSPHYLLSLNGDVFVRDGGIAIGPGERLLLLDATVGG